MFISPNILCPSMLLQRIIISDIVPGSFLFFSKYIIFFFVSSLNFLIDSMISLVIFFILSEKKEEIENGLKSIKAKVARLTA